MTPIELPSKPATLLELEARRTNIRHERSKIKVEIEAIQERSRRIESGADLDASAERLVNGEAVAAEREPLSEELKALRRRCDLLTLASDKLAVKVASGREAHKNALARALRPAHRHAVRRIHQALSDLEAANAEEQAVHDMVPGLQLACMSFPNIGSRGPRGGPIKYWTDFAKRAGLLDDPE